MSETFDDHLESLRAAVNRALDECLRPPDRVAGRLWEAMAYGVMGGGKRVRPILVLLAAEVCGGDTALALPAACAAELAHTASLIHDDLPAMDNDDRRRGRPTCHRAFDQATALLAGDALESLAFEVLTRSAAPPATVVGQVRELALAIGPRGMAVGQAVDLAARHQASRAPRPGRAARPPATIDLRRAEVEFAHLHKTAWLMRACARMGARSAGADPAHLDALGLYGEKIGLAFQVVDDLLDATPGSPEGAGTYPGAMGMEASRAEAARLTEEAIGALRPLGAAAGPLAHLARRLLTRTS